MIEKIIMSGLLICLVAVGVWGLVHGEKRYMDGLMKERAKWEAVIAETNARNAQADHLAEERRAANQAEWAKIAEEAKSQMYPIQTEDDIKRCSLPPNVLQFIKRAKAP